IFERGTSAPASCYIQRSEVRVYDDERRIAGSIGGIFSKSAYLCFQLVLMPRVISIQKSDVAPATFLDSPVPSCGYACIQLANVYDLLAVTADRSGGVISGAVVYDQYFEIA